jgi:hypothetical protein
LNPPVIPYPTLRPSSLALLAVPAWHFNRYAQLSAKPLVALLALIDHAISYLDLFKHP